MTTHEASWIQLDLPQETGNLLKPLQDLIRPADLTGDGLEEEPHVTVKYGLHTSQPQDVAALTGEPLELRIGDTAIFPDESHENVVVLVTSQKLLDLNKTISATLECTDSFPGYSAHISIARVKPGCGWRYNGIHILDGERAECTQMSFFSKSGERTTIELKAKEYNRRKIQAERPKPDQA